MATNLDKRSIKETVGAPGVHLVDFWAEWCSPCKMMLPVIEKLSSEYRGRASVGKLDVEEFPEVAAEYEVSSLPTVIIFKDGQEMWRRSGAFPAPVITAELDKLC